MRALAAGLVLTAATGLGCRQTGEAPAATTGAPAEVPAAGADGPAAGATPAAQRSWLDIVQTARGQTVTWMMWQGDPLINAYVSGFLAPKLKERYGITLRAVAGQGGTIVSTLMTEREAGAKESAIDLCWINGETFYQLRQIDALHGPFVASLPNAKYIDLDNRFIGVDFQQPVKGWECPWGNVQHLLIHDSERVPTPPLDRAALTAWVKQHPGRFTFDTGFTGMTFLKEMLIDVAGGPERLAGAFDQARYDAAASALWAWVREVRPYLWRRGETFPSDVAQIHQMFTSGEVDFTMSNNDGEVDNKVKQGVFPPSARAFVFTSGTIQNTHYIGIPRTSGHLEAALVAVNFMISPEAQLEKMKPEVWGDGTVLALSRLDEEWAARFRGLPRRQYGPQRAEIQDRALQELAPEYMIRLYEDFRSEILEK